MSIEDVAAENPDAIIKQPIDVFTGITNEIALDFAKRLGFSGQMALDAADIFVKLYNIFIDNDCTLLEINPFTENSDNTVMCMDCKLSFDDNALFRHKELLNLRDVSQEDKREVDAAKYDLNYIGLDGSIGCLVNGAGLAMATMDIIKLHGGEPANFLDVGGGVQEHQVREALRIIAEDPKVKGVLVNVFGGIVDCAIIANLAGTNVENAKKVLEESGLPIQSAVDLDDT